MSTRVALITSGSRAEGPQHLDIVRRLDAEAAAGQGQPRHQPRADPQRCPRRQAHRRTAPYRRRRQDQPVDIGNRGAAFAGQRDDGNSSAHAFAKKVERRARIAPAQHLSRGGGVGGKCRASRPHAPLRGRAKAALIVGVGGDAVLCPDLAGGGKGVAVVVEPVERQDHRLRPVIGQPLPSTAAPARRP